MVTPVQEIGGILFKREDLYTGRGGVNGTKLRQAEFCVDYLQKSGFSTIGTACSIHSPQAPIVASVCAQRGLGCVVAYGGTNWKRLTQCRMPSVAHKFGAHVHILAKTGRHSVLNNRLQAINGLGIVGYGMRVDACFDAMLEHISSCVSNIPNELDNLVVTCGSGFSSSAILLGLQKYNKRVGNVWLVHTAPDRRKKISQAVGCIPQNVRYISLYERIGFSYEKPAKETRFYGINMHPLYEAKTFTWMRDEHPELLKQKTLFWIIGNTI